MQLNLTNLILMYKNMLAQLSNTQKKRPPSLSKTAFGYVILVELLLAKCSVSSSQTCDRYTEWRAAYVVQTCVVAELYR